jgi:hypothetical protein
MRVRISGPSLGPVHTTLWSSGRSKPGAAKGCLLGFVMAACIVLPVEALIRYRWADILAGVLVLAAIWARRAEKRKAAAGTVEAIVADLNTRPTEIRARIREQTRTGELDCIPGWHWADGDRLERDTESQAKHSDRR